MQIVPSGNFGGQDLLTLSHIPVLVFPHFPAEDETAESKLFSGLVPCALGLMHCSEVLRVGGGSRVPMKPFGSSRA